MAAVPNPSDLTRHQLDELDALLQRMLALPLNGAPQAIAEPRSAAAAPKWRADAPHAAPSLPATLAPPVVVLEPMAVAAKPTSMPVSYSIPVRLPSVESQTAERPNAVPLFGPPPRTATQEPEPRTLRGVDAPPVVAKVVDPEPIPWMQAAPHADAAFAALQGEVVAPVPMWAWPLYAFNWTIETFLSLFGPLGAGATAPAAKNLLAVCGMVLLTAAGLWCARGMGYISW